MYIACREVLGSSKKKSANNQPNNKKYTQNTHIFIVCCFRLYSIPINITVRIIKI